MQAVVHYVRQNLGIPETCLACSVANEVIELLASQYVSQQENANQSDIISKCNHFLISQMLKDFLPHSDY